MVRILCSFALFLAFLHCAQGLSLMHMFAKTAPDDSSATSTSKSIAGPDKQGSSGQMQWHTDDSAGAPKMWYDIALSSDGKQRTAVVIDGNIWSSSDSGKTWTEDKSIGATKLWRAITMSRDGVKRIAVESNGEIWMSLDSGAVWQRVHKLGSRLLSVAMDAEGVQVIVAAYNQGIVSSEDGGQTWNMSSAPKGLTWRSVAMSADGSHRVAAVNGGSIYVSQDSGATWKQCDTPGAGAREDTGDGWFEYGPRWISVAMSADGSQVTAVPVAGHIWRSMDSGVTWQKDETQGEREWASIAMSFSGANRVACVTGGNIFLSVDSGTTWIEEKSVADSPDGNMWYAVATSGDGDQHAAAIMKGGLWQREVADDEFSFLQLASNGEHDKFADFVVTWINKHAGTVTNFADFNFVLAYYSGVQDRKSFKQLVDELQSAQWIEGLNVFKEAPAPVVQAGLWRDTQPLEKRSFAQVAAKGDQNELVDWVRLWITNHWGTVTDDKELRALMEFHMVEQKKRRFTELTASLTSATWVKGLQVRKVDVQGEHPVVDPGFAKVANTRNRGKLMYWLHHWISKHGGKVTNKRKLSELVEWYKGAQDQWDFRGLLKELKAATWIKGFDIDCDMALDEELFMELVESGDRDKANTWVSSWITNHGGIVTNQGGLSGLLGYFNGENDRQRFSKLVGRLKEVDWIHGLQDKVLVPAGVQSAVEPSAAKPASKKHHDELIEGARSWIRTRWGKATNKIRRRGLVKSYGGEKDQRHGKNDTRERELSALVDSYKGATRFKTFHRIQKNSKFVR